MTPGPSQIPAKAELFKPMLPGFRFLFAAILLSMSLLIFALGAAALLRSAHEEFASNPSWRATPEVTFAQSSDAAPPVLAALRLELPAAEKSQGAPASAASAEDAAAREAPTGASEQIAASKPEESLPREAEKTQTANSEGRPGENIAVSEAAPASAQTPAATEPVQAVATRVAAAATIPATPGGDPPAAVRGDPIAAQFELVDAGAAAKIATLGGPPVDIEETQPKAKADTKAGTAKPNQSPADQDEAKKKAEAKRAANRRKIAAARAKQAAQQALQPLQPDPFFQQPAQGAPSARVPSTPRQ
jgi:hypothetical protein